MTTKTVMRTQQEILQRIKDVKDKDFFGDQVIDYIYYLDFEYAKPFLKPDAQPENWQPEDLSKEAILLRMKNYMGFAWQKAIDQRGLSASRSMSHYTAWVWLIGDESRLPNLMDYDNYGLPHLRTLCQHYGWPLPTGDEDE